MQRLEMVMDARSELAAERFTLAKEDADLIQGEIRIVSQEELVADLRRKGIDAGEAERLLQLLRQTLSQWQQHRVLILQRIAHLEAKIAESNSSSGGMVGRVAP